MTPRLVGINHVALEVEDVERSLAFYGKLFELRFRGRSGNAAFVDIGDQFLALMKGRAHAPDGAGTSGSSSTTRRRRGARSRASARRSFPAAGSTSSTPTATGSRSCSTTRSSSRSPPRCSAAWTSSSVSPRSDRRAPREGARGALVPDSEHGIAGSYRHGDAVYLRGGFDLGPLVAAEKDVEGCLPELVVRQGDRSQHRPDPRSERIVVERDDPKRRPGFSVLLPVALDTRPSRACR